MKYHIHKAVVIGSGTMGAAIAAHLANAGVPVTLLDIVPNDAPADDQAARNKIVNDGWDRCLKAKPANLMSSELRTFVKLGNLEDDFGAVAEADWVCEAIVENLTIKQELMRRIDEVRKPNGIVTTNTSGIPVSAIAAGRSKEFKKHFLGTHFFNPPRYLKLLEIIPTKDTEKEVVEFFSWFGEYRLGKGIVLCKDTPNFIGNRVAFGTGAFAMDFILKNGYTVDEVDAITGPLIGYVRDLRGDLRPVFGVSGAFVLGDPIEQGVLSASFSQSAGLVKKEKQLLIFRDGKPVRSIDAPEGGAWFGFEPNGGPNWVRFANGSCLVWRSGAPETGPCPAAEEPAAGDMPERVESVESMGADWLAVRTASGIWAVRIRPERTVYRLPEAER